MEHKYVGPKSILILGLTSGKIGLSANGWSTSILYTCYFPYAYSVVTSNVIL